MVFSSYYRTIVADFLSCLLADLKYLARWTLGRKSVSCTTLEAWSCLPQALSSSWRRFRSCWRREGSWWSCSAGTGKAAGHCAVRCCTHGHLSTSFPHFPCSSAGWADVPDFSDCGGSGAARSHYAVSKEPKSGQNSGSFHYHPRSSVCRSSFGSFDSPVGGSDWLHWS